MRNVKSICVLLAVGLAVVLPAASPSFAQTDDIAELKREIAELRNQIRDILEFHDRLCRTLREESIVIFPTTPATEDEKVARAIEEFKAAVSKANRAMATRDHVLHQQADQLRNKAENEMKALNPELIIPALKAEVAAATNDVGLCSSMMMALGAIGKDAVIPYFEEIVVDRERPGLVRRIASEALLSVNKDRAIDILVPVAGDFEQQNFPERFYVIYLLSETKDPRVEPMLLQGAKLDPDKSSRCHHINGLAHYKTAEARATLEWVIANDDYEHARTNALASLQRMLGDEAAYPLLWKYSQEAMMKDGKSPDFRVRNQAYQAWNRLKMEFERQGKPLPGEEPKAPAPGAEQKS
ncbi:MAG: HEAT repeat domain-containing protein [Planctomycetes bacterium]|nr:HEAT repeat domain-containing protein [Planctomycetota bacterium]